MEKPIERLIKSARADADFKLVRLRCPRCNSRHVLARISKQVRWCRHCGFEWPMDESKLSPTEGTLLGEMPDTASKAPEPGTEAKSHGD